MLNILKHIGNRGATCLCVVCNSVFEVTDRFTAKEVHAGDQCPTCKNLPKNTPTQSLLHQIFNYDPHTGNLTWKRDFSRRYKDDDPTSVASNGYLVVTLDRTHLAHRIIWLMQTGNSPEILDHINHIRSDNRWENLRPSDQVLNNQNKSVNKNNTSGYLGVSYMPLHRQFRAYITIDRKHIHLGLFPTAEDAYQARLAADKQYGFHPNHGCS